MQKTIEKKILPDYFAAVVTGNKTFELRKDEDNIQIGDILILKEFDKNEYTGRYAQCNVSYVLRDAKEFGLMDGYCAIAIECFFANLRYERESREDVVQAQREYCHSKELPMFMPIDGFCAVCGADISKYISKSMAEQRLYTSCPRCKRSWCD